MAFSLPRPIDKHRDTEPQPRVLLACRGVEELAVGGRGPFLLIEAAARGRHVVIVPRSVVRDALAAGRVRILAQVESAHAGSTRCTRMARAELARRAIEKVIATARASVAAANGRSRAAMNVDPRDLVAVFGLPAGPRQGRSREAVRIWHT